MTNPAETDKKKNEPGETTRNIGILIAVLSVVLLISQGFRDVATAAPWIGLAVSFALIVIGYLQKIAANK